jgi:hypothetical protein
MTSSPNAQPTPDPSDSSTSADPEVLAGILKSLRRKESTWSQWGEWCQRLQKEGYTPQRIFEETGFEPIQQNQIIVSAQVYASMLAVGVSSEVQQHFEQRGSDSLYEFRILSQRDRAAAATLAVQRGIDSEGARDIAKAIKDFSRLSKPPEGFSTTAGDAVAYSYYKLANQQNELSERSRLIAQALRFVETESARKKIEVLLTESVSQTPPRTAPRLSVYRLESDDDVPRLLPVAGQMPLTVADWKAVLIPEPMGAFGIVQFSGTGAWVAIPGWSVVLNADDPVAIAWQSDQLPQPLPGKPEEVLVIVDRSKRDWQPDQYFLVSEGDRVVLQWLETEPSQPIFGQVLLVVRPKRMLDEDYAKDPWQIDE